MKLLRQLIWFTTVGVVAGAGLLTTGPATPVRVDQGEIPDQQPGPPGTIRVRVRLIPVDVSVTDQSGRPVADLKQSDFRIFENGREQEIRHFFVQKITASTTPVQADQRSIPNPSPSPVPEIAPQTGRTFLILMGHGRHQTPFKALDALIRFVRTGLLPQDRVAILAYTRMTDFTSDHEQVARLLSRFKAAYEKIESWREEQSYMAAHLFGSELIGFAPQFISKLVQTSRFMQSKMAEIFGPDGALTSHQVAPARMPENPAIAMDRARVQSILTHAVAADTAESTGEFGSAVIMTALEAWEAEALMVGLPPDIFAREAEGSIEDMANIFTGVQQLRYMEGEKHLLFFTEFGLLFPFGNEVYDDYIARYAADARVAIDTFQTGGLDGLILRSPSYNKSLTTGQPAPRTSWAQSVMFATVKNVAEQTGGHAALAEDIGKALKRTNETSRVEYLLGYYPRDENWDGKYRQIEVKVNRPGLKVFFRHGYYARDTAQTYDRQDLLIDSRISAAAGFESEMRDVSFEVSATKIADANGQPQIKIDLSIHPATNGFTTINGLHTAKLRIAIFYADAHQNFLGEDWKTMDLQLQEDSYQRFLRSGIPFSTMIPLKAPNQMLKVVVYDVGGDRVGSRIIKIK